MRNAEPAILTRSAEERHDEPGSDADAAAVFEAGASLVPMPGAAALAPPTAPAGGGVGDIDVEQSQESGTAYGRSLRPREVAQKTVRRSPSRSAGRRRGGAASPAAA